MLPVICECPIGVLSVCVVRKMPRMRTLHRVITCCAPRQKMYRCPTHERKSDAQEDYVISAVHNDPPPVDATKPLHCRCYTPEAMNEMVLAVRAPGGEHSSAGAVAYLHANRSRPRLIAGGVTPMLLSMLEAISEQATGCSVDADGQGITR